MTEKSSWAGATYTEADTNTYLRHTGGAFNTYAPVVVQSNTPALTTAAGRWWRAGRLIQGNAICVLSGTGTGGSAITVSPPVNTYASYSSFSVLGIGAVFDNSAGFLYTADLVWDSASTLKLRRRVDGAAASYLGNAGFTAALASGDIIAIKFEYEAAFG